MKDVILVTAEVIAAREDALAIREGLVDHMRDYLRNGNLGGTLRSRLSHGEVIPGPEVPEHEYATFGVKADAEA